MNKKDTGVAKSKLSPTAIVILVAIAAAAGFGAVYGILGTDSNVLAPPNAESGKPSSTAKSGLAAYSKGTMVTFVARKEPQDLPPIEFVKADGSQTSLKAWRGKVVLLNLWATWCGPCRKEMPDLDRLKADLGSEDFDLVALSIDRTGLEKPKKFLEEIGVKNLELYNNSTGKLAASLKAFGMPTTLLINRKGQEIGRMVGPAEWASPEAYALIRAAIAETD